LSGKEKAALASKDADEEAAELAQLKSAKGPSKKGARGGDDEEEAAAPKAKTKKEKAKAEEEDFSKVKGKKTKTGKDFEEKEDEAEEEKEEDEAEKPAQKKDKKKAKWGGDGEEASKPEAKAGKNAKQEKEEDAPGPAAASAEDASEDSLTVAGVVASCEPLRKKGNFLLSVTVGSKQVQVVAPKEYDEGQKVKIALEGATLENGKTVKREKIAGEWSEGSLIN